MRPALALKNEIKIKKDKLHCIPLACIAWGQRNFSQYDHFRKSPSIIAIQLNRKKQGQVKVNWWLCVENSRNIYKRRSRFQCVMVLEYAGMCLD